jgi:hypothetical protein
MALGKDAWACDGAFGDDYHFVVGKGLLRVLFFLTLLDYCKWTIATFLQPFP